MLVSRIEELIRAKCPDGVEFYKLDEICIIQNGYTPSKKVSEYWKNGDVPWFRMEDIRTNGKILNYALQNVHHSGVKGDVFPANSIIFSTTATVGEHALITVPFLCNQQLTHIHIKANQIDKIDIKYIFYYADIIDDLCKKNVKGGGTLPAVSLEKFRAFEIPVPPIEIQQEIVRILDKFTELEAGLQAELETRKKQYQYYLDNYFDNQTENLQLLSQIGTLQRGKRFVHADAVENKGVACIHYGELYTYYGVYTNNVRSRIREELRPKMRYAHKGDIIIVGAGENNIDIGIGVVWDGDEAVAVHDACYILKHQQNPKYISYYLRSSSYHNQIKRFVSEGKICSISAEGIGRAMIPIPSLEEQTRIVKIFDAFDIICNDKKIGLKAEIPLRYKQYEYYRDKLLTFKRKEV